MFNPDSPDLFSEPEYKTITEVGFVLCGGGKGGGTPTFTVERGHSTAVGCGFIEEGTELTTQ